MSRKVHDRIEMLAGAIALGEASDKERGEYREHIATCPECVNALGGECEIERVASMVGAARESEIWQPDLRDVVAARMQRRKRSLRYGFGIAGLALAISLGVHTLIASGVTPLSAAPSNSVGLDAVITRVALEQRIAAQQPRPAPQPAQRRMIVQHNVVQINRAPLPAPAAAPAFVAQDAKPQEIANVTVHAPPPQFLPKSAHSNVPVWRRKDTAAWRTVATTTTTSLSESAPQSLTHRAESMQVFTQHAARDAAPVGGETAINPQPPMIAYDEGAEGTTVFEVLIDERGNPTKCVITKPAGYSVLDAAVCKAAMQARYTPKTIDGRAVPGVYHDAFTFRMTNDSIEGIPKPIQ